MELLALFSSTTMWLNYRHVIAYAPLIIFGLGPGLFYQAITTSQSSEPLTLNLKQAIESIENFFPGIQRVSFRYVITEKPRGASKFHGSAFGGSRKGVFGRASSAGLLSTLD